MANPSIIGHLQNRLKKTLQDKSIAIGELDSGTGNYSIVSCLGFEHYVDEESTHNLGLFPFRVADAFDYWLSLSVQFNFGSKKVTHVSISFFDETKFKMFRAEWANNESKIVHAQPHWHIHNKKPDLISPLWDEEAISVFEEEVKEVINDKVKNIHFAMSSSWHKEYNHVQNLADSKEEEVLNWIDGVLIYTREQLTYLHDKTKVPHSA